MEFKIHPHFTKAVIAYFVIVLVVSVGIWAYISKTKTSAPVSSARKELPTPNFKVTEYSLSGKVTAVKDNVVTLTVTRIFVGPNGNYPASEEKTVTIAPKTPVTLVSMVNNKMVRTVGKISDISAGKNIVVYSRQDIAHQASFVITRVDILLPK